MLHLTSHTPKGYQFINRSRLASLTAAVLTSILLAGCVPMNAGSSYPSDSSYSGGYYPRSDSGYDSGYYDYDSSRDRYREERLRRERERAERERRRLEWERNQLERERQRLSRDRYREERRERDERREREERERREREEREREHYAPPPQRNENTCPPGFSPRSEKCSDKERKSGCRDIRRMPNGMYCVDR